MTTKRKQIISLVVIILVSAVLTMLLVSLKSSPKRKPPIDTRPVVGVMTVQNNPVQLTVPVIGRLSAQEKVSILAEVTGVLEINNKEFLTGQSYRKGDVMLRINPEETALTLKSQRSSLLTAIASLLPELKFDHPESYKQWNDYIQACDIESRAQPLPEPVDEREKLFVAAKPYPQNPRAINKPVEMIFHSKNNPILTTKRLKQTRTIQKTSITNTNLGPGSIDNSIIQKYFIHISLS